MNIKLLNNLFILLITINIFINISSCETDNVLLDSSTTTPPQNNVIENIKNKLKDKKKTFKIDEISSNHTLIRDTLIKRGYVETKTSRYYDIKWSWCWEILRVTSSRQIVNHFINHDEIGSKSGLTRNMNNLYLNASKDNDIQLKNQISKIFPRSYILSNPLEKESFIKDFNRNNNKLVGISNNDLLASSSSSNIIDDHHEITTSSPSSIIYPKQDHIDGNKNIWIVKPSANARGVGIEIFNDLSKLLEYTKKSNDEFIVQKYIESPYTILNTKFDIRQFVLVKSLNPLVIFKLRECYLRFCSIEYSTDNLNDRYVHLSNFQVQKEYLKNHKTPFPDNQWSLSKFKEHLIKENDGKNIWDDELNEKIKKLIITTIKSWPQNGQNKGSFELLGFDILLSDKLEPLLLEVNTNPGLHLLTDNVKIHHKIAIDDLFKVILDNQDKWDDQKQIKQWINNLSNDEQIQLFGQWEPIYIGEFNESIINLPIKKQRIEPKIKKVE